MPTQEQYDQLHKELADKFRCSPRVIQYIRSCYGQNKSKIEGDPANAYEFSITEMRKHLEADLVEVNKSWRAVKLDYIYDLSKPEQGLKKDNPRILRLQAGLPHVVGYIDKVAFRMSLIGFLKRITVEAFKEIIETEVKI